MIAELHIPPYLKIDLYQRELLELKEKALKGVIKVVGRTEEESKKFSPIDLELKVVQGLCDMFFVESFPLETPLIRTKRIEVSLSELAYSDLCEKGEYTGSIPTALKFRARVIPDREAL